MTEPSHLALGVSPGGALRCRDRGIERDIAPQVRQELGKTHCLHCGEAGIEAAYGNRLCLGQGARFDHLNEPGIAGCVKPLSRRREQDCPEPINRFRFCLLLPSPDGHSGGSHYLKGADEPLFISGEEPLCSLRIEPGKPFAKPDPAQRPMKPDRLLPDLRGDVRDRCQTPLDCPQIEPGAANDDRQAAGLRCLGDLVKGEGPPSSGRPALARVDEAVEPVRCARLRRLVGPCRQDPKIAIDLQAVGVDDRAAV